MNNKHLFFHNAEPYTQNQRLLQNVLFLNELHQIDNHCQEQGLPRPVALKGISFLNRIYKVDERAMTDIDLLIEKKDLAIFRLVLQQHGYIERMDAKWRADNYKYIFCKNVGSLQVTMELHTQLYPLSLPQYRWTTHDSSHGVQTLTLIEEILYLSYHYAYQHTFLKKFWLEDIYRLSNNQKIWTTDLWQRAKDMGLLHALSFTAHALNCSYAMNIEIPQSNRKFFIRYLLNQDFIDEASKYRLRYYIIKHLTKKTLADAFIYDIYWFLFRIKKRFKQ